MHYLRGWFCLDALSIAVAAFDIIPVASPASSSSSSSTSGDGAEDSLQSLRSLRMMRVLRLIKLIRLLRASRLFQRCACERERASASVRARACERVRARACERASGQVSVCGSDVTSFLPRALPSSHAAGRRSSPSTTRSSRCGAAC